MHHTLLSRSRLTGVTIQTLHPEYFDQGKIIRQTPAPGFEHDCENVKQLSQRLAPKGADLLLDCIVNYLYLDDLATPRSPGSLDNSNVRDLTKARPAPKITAADRFLDWTHWTGEEIIRRHQVIGPLWSLIPVDDHSHSYRRIIWSTGFDDVNLAPDINLPIGQPMVIGSQFSPREVYVRACDGKILKIGQIKVEGGKQAEPLIAATRACINHPGTTSAGGLLFSYHMLKTLPHREEVQETLPPKPTKNSHIA